VTSLFTLEKRGDVEALAKLLRESDSEAVRKRAAKILGGLDETDDTAVNRLVAVAQSDPDGGVRAAAIDALDQQGAVEQLVTAMSGSGIDAESAEWANADALVEALGASEPEMRMAAATVLGRIGSSRATAALVKRLDEPNPRVRARVARALGRIGDPGAVEPLAARVADEHLTVRRAIAEALGLVGGEAALEALVDLLDDDTEMVRRIAASSLGNFGTTRPVNPLVAALADSSAVVRQAAVFSLIELLSNAPSRRNHQLRETIVERLSAEGDRNVVGPLVDIVEEGTQPHQRRNAAWLLGEVAGPDDGNDAIAALAGLLSDDDDMAAQFAATSLASIGGEAVETRLLELLDRDGPGTAKAAFVLGKVGGERSRERLDGLVDETDDEAVRRRAFAALSKLGGRR
jgi:HEAT repeat protein